MESAQDQPCEGVCFAGKVWAQTILKLLQKIILYEVYYSDNLNQLIPDRMANRDTSALQVLVDPTGLPQSNLALVEHAIVQAMPAPEGEASYEQGYRDALESVVLALKADPGLKLFDAVTAALDAYANNAPELDDLEHAEPGGALGPDH